MLLETGSDQRDLKAKGITGALGLASLAALAGLLLSSGYSQLADPFIRNDDFPALLREAEVYYPKTLQEGRWLNYWWHLRPFETPPWLNYLVFLLGNAVFAGALALHAVGTERLAFAALASALIALAPQSVLMAAWFNTLIPGIWILAAFSMLALFLDLRACRRMMFLMIPVTLITYSTYPLIVLLVCLAHRDAGRSIREYVKTLACFFAAFVLGIGFMFGLNWLIHGVFGLEYVHWRLPTPAHDIAGIVKNLALLQEFYGKFFLGLGFSHAWFAVVNIAAFLGALALIARHRPVEALSLLTAVAAGLALLSVLSLKDGVLILFRATQFVWMAYGIALARAAAILTETAPGRGRSALAALAALVLISAVYGAQVYRRNLPFQVETRRIADAIPADAREVRILGEYYLLPEAVDALIQHTSAIRDRIRWITGLPAVSCDVTPEACTSPAPPTTITARDGRTVIETQDGIAWVVLPGAGG